MKKWLIYSVLGFFFIYFSPNLMAQVKVMPVGDSITWGKINQQPPQGTDEGYRNLLHTKLINAGVSVQFVGADGSAQNLGYFLDGATIGDFIHPDSAKGDIAAKMTQYQPNIVILHIGTNNIGNGTPLGDYTTPNSIINQLYTMVTKITDASSVNYLLLCKIIPRYTTPGTEVETVDYNNAIEIMLNQLKVAQKAKVRLIDMWTPFYANRVKYYNYDVDKIHPSAEGYNYMATVFSEYIAQLLKPSYTDEFNRTTLGSDWVVSPGMTIVNVGESGGGALKFTATGYDQWDDLAVWKTSKGLSTCSIKLHSGSTPADLDKLGLAVGLDAESATASGYLVWVYNGSVRVRCIVNGNANIGADVNQYPMIPLQPGDVFKVSYRKSSEANYFTIQINNNAPLTLRDVHKYYGNGDNLYSGVMFRRSPGAAFNCLVDNFVVESQLPDILPPGRIYDLLNFSMTNTSITLTWTAVGNDGYMGTASSYDLRYSTTQIQNENDFAKANIVSGLPTPKDANATEIFTLTGLQAATSYYFCIRAVDSWGNKGDLSDAVYGRTNAAGQVVESFDRAPQPDGTIGPDWLIDTNEYRLEYNTVTHEGELTNFQTDGQWGRVAVYKGRTNPSVVKMVWGKNAQKNSIGQGGLALMLTSANLVADGYLLWVRTQSAKIYLYQIDNGSVGTVQVDVVPYTLKDDLGNIKLPQSGDTMSVVMDWNFVGGNKFDVFINSKMACDRPLFDPQRYVNSAVKYAGIMLGRLNKTNNVTSFITTTEYSGVGGLTKVVKPTPMIGTVGTLLADSLKAIVSDANGTPLPNVPVYFSVISPADATVSASQTPIDQLHIEAEWGLLTGTYNVRNDDPGASGESYIVAPAGGPESGTATYNFYVSKDTTYNLYARVITSFEHAYAVQFKMDNEVKVWNFFSSRGNNSNGWNWERIQFNIPLKLGRSMHRLVITKLHDNVKIDKLILSPSFNLPIGKAFLEQLLTDESGIATTALTLSKTSGLNQVLARAYGIPDTVIFRAHGRSDVPTTAVKTNDGQIGAARDTLKLPLVVTLYDHYNNPVPNVIVNFAVTGGDGKILASKDTTDNTGKAVTRFVLGIQIAENKIRATVTGYALPAIDFTATASSGLVKKIQAVPVTAFPGRHYIGQALPDFVKVKIFDDKNNPVSNVGVTFQVAKGPAIVGISQPKKTDAQGFALDTLKLGNTAGIARVIAKVGVIQDTVLRDSVFYKGAFLDYYGGTGQQRSVGDTLENRLKVKVVNNKNEFVVGHPVSFVIAKKESGFRFPDGKDSVVVLTGGDGIAKTNVRVGPVCGAYANIVVAKSTDGFYPLKQKNTTLSPSFTIYATSNASVLIKVAGDSAEGVVRGTLKIPLTVKMVDKSNKPVTDQPVDWVIKAGGGQFEGTLMPNIRMMTDGDGISRMVYSLGPTAGVYNNLVEVSASNGLYPLLNSPILFRFSAKSSAADAMSAVTSTTLSGTIGKPLNSPIQVMLTDKLGNSVVGAEVKFSVIKGGGALGGTADTTKTVTIENAQGVASIAWTLGTKAGSLNNVLEASASNGILALKGSPIQFKASGTPDSVSASKSVISATSPIQATLKDTCFIIITLTDAFGNPVSGKRVGLQVTGEDCIKYDPILPTDSQGRAKGYLQSLKAGEKQIRAVDITDNIPLIAMTKVIFTPDGAHQMRIFSGNDQTGNAGTILRDSLVVKIMDQYSNAVAFGPVKFEMISGGGHIIGSQTVYSDSNGLAHTHLVLGPNPGDNVVKVTANVLIGKEMYFSAKGIQGLPASIRMKSGSGQRGAAGEVLPEPLITQVVDKSLNPVAGVDVQYKVTIGKGTVVTPQPCKTDERGYATCDFKPDTIAGTTTWIEATNSTLSGSPVRFSVNSVAGTAKKIRYASGDKQSGYVGETVQNPLVAKVTDSYGNGVTGVSVQFNVVTGEATVQGSLSTKVTSDPSGQAVVYVKLGHKVGSIKLEAVNPMLQGSPVGFTLYANTAQAKSIEKFRGDNQKGRIGQELVEPLRVRVLDEYGNGVYGISVYFVKNTGGGSIIDAQPVVSDSNGVASVRFRAANTPGKSTIDALWDKIVTFNVETVVDYNIPVLDKSLIADVYDVAEGSEVIVPLVASDADNHPLTFQIADLFYPAEMKIQDQAPNTAIFRWTPNFNQSGLYRITLRVIDGYGGADQDTVRINVINVDRPPEKVVVFPVHSDTSLQSGKTVTFWVNYRDPDGDVLHYIWKVDGVTKGNDSPILQYMENASFGGKRTVDAFVSDGIATVSQRWSVTFVPASKVTMSTMAALFEPNSMTVTVQWSTSHEQSNIGFNVLRSQTEDGRYEKINAELIPSKKEGQYVFIDIDVQAGHKYYYKIVDLDAYGNSNESSTLTVQVPMPDKFAIMQNYPNPFNPSTTIRYNIARKEKVKLSVYNMLGQCVAVLVDREHEPGFYTIQWDGRDEMGRQTATGVYLYRFESSSQIQVFKMVKLQ